MCVWIYIFPIEILTNTFKKHYKFDKSFVISVSQLKRQYKNADNLKKPFTKALDSRKIPKYLNKYEYV